MKPLLLLDVDGVLCPLGNRAGEELIEHHVTGHMYLRYSVHTAGRLAALADVFRLVWATSWEDEANEVIAPLFGLPPLPVIFFEREAEEGETWKLPSIKEYVGDRPFAYVDDDIGSDALASARARAVPTLLLPIRGDRGLLQPDVDELLAFAASL